MKDSDRCSNCGREFADHNYIPDSIDEYRCPVPVCESGYGYFTGGDPRKFFPDYESCTPEEIANHKRACEFAEKGGDYANLDCPSGWITGENGVVAHILRAPFGIGGYTVELETTFEPIEHDYED